MVDQLTDLFRTTHKVKTVQMTKDRGRHCGDIDLSTYLPNVTDPVPLVLDLLIDHITSKSHKATDELIFNGSSESQPTNGSQWILTISKIGHEVSNLWISFDVLYRDCQPVQYILHQGLPRRSFPCHHVQVSSYTCWLCCRGGDTPEEGTSFKESDTDGVSSFCGSRYILDYPSPPSSFPPFPLFFESFGAPIGLQPTNRPTVC